MSKTKSTEDDSRRLAGLYRTDRRFSISCPFQEGADNVEENWNILGEHFEIAH